MNRKITYRIYPTATQNHSLMALLAAHHAVYNAALARRIEVYRTEKRSLTFAEQCKELTMQRKDNAALRAINAQSLQVTLKRLDLAFKSFYRRLQSSQTPGFPRFKALARYSGWGYKSHADGWRVSIHNGVKHGKLRLSGIGVIAMRGKARTNGKPKNCQIMRKADKWYISITIDCVPLRTGGTKNVELDTSSTSGMVLLHHESTVTTVELNNSHLKAELPKLKKLQQAIARKKNPSSNQRLIAIKLMSNTQSKISRQRKDLHHKIAAEIVGEHGLITTASLPPKTTIKLERNNKSKLNQAVLNSTSIQFLSLVKSKAEEAGIIWFEIPRQRLVKNSEAAISERFDWALHWASGQGLAKLGSCVTRSVEPLSSN